MQRRTFLTGCAAALAATPAHARLMVNQLSGFGTRLTGDTQTKWNSADKGTNVTLSAGDLAMEKAGAGFEAVRGVDLLENLANGSGKLYFELTANTTGVGVGGIMTSAADLNSYVGSDTAGWGFQFDAGPKWWYGGSNGTHGTTEPTTNDILILAVDLNSQKMWTGVNGTWHASGDPAAGTGNIPFTTAIPATGAYLAWSSQSAQKVTLRTSANYTVPSGFTFISGG